MKKRVVALLCAVLLANTGMEALAAPEAVRGESVEAAEELEAAEETEISEMVEAAEETEIPEMVESASVTEVPEMDETAGVAEVPEMDEAANVTEISGMDEQADVMEIPEIDEQAPVTETALVITKQPTDLVVAEGEDGIFDIVATGSGLKYLWMRSKDGQKTWEKAFYPGYLTDTMTVPVKSHVYDYYFYCEVTDDRGNKIQSDIVRPRRVPVKIVKEPESIIVKENTEAVFSVKAEGTGLKYLWMRSKDGGTTWEKAFYTGYTTANMTVPVKSHVYPYLFYCEVTDRDGNLATTEIVHPVRVPVSITEEPTDLVVKENENAIFRVKAEGTGLKYLWMRSKDNGVTWEKAFYTGYTTANMTVPVKSHVYPYLFYCEITDIDGNKVTTGIVKPKREAVRIMEEPRDIEVLENDNAVFSVKAEGTGLKYLWMRSKDNGVTWEKAFYAGYLTDTMTVPVKSHVFPYLFYCEITDADKNVVRSAVVTPVKAKPPIGGVELLWEKDHSYGEGHTGLMLLDRQRFAANAKAVGYKALYEEAVPVKMGKTDICILRFTAEAKERCGHITVLINDGEYKGTFTLPTQATEYYIPVTGLEKMSKIEFVADTADQAVELADVELINYGSLGVTNLRTGLYNREVTTQRVYEESEKLAGPQTAMTSDETYLYAVKNGKLTIYDLSKSREKLQAVGSLTGLGNTRDLEISEAGDLLVITARENGVYFVDIKDVTKPKILSHYDTLELATGLSLYDHYAFVCSRMYGVEIIDFSDVTHPICVGETLRVNEEYYDCYVCDGFLYVGVWAHKKVEIYSLADVCNPAHVATVNVDGECGGVTVENHILYVATGYHGQDSTTGVCSPGYGMGNGMEIYDVSDPAHPVWLSSAKIDGRYRNASYDHWKVKVSGNYAYFTNIYNGVYVYDVSDPKAPKRVDHMTVYIPKTSTNYVKITQGSFILPYDTLEHGQGPVMGITLTNGRMYFSDEYTGVYAYDAPFIGVEEKAVGVLQGTKMQQTVPSVPGYNVSVWKDSYGVQAAEINDNYIYAACGDGGIKVLDRKLNLIRTVSGKGAVKDVLQIGQYLYTAEGASGLCAYEISGDDLLFRGQCKTSFFNACFSQLERGSNPGILFVQAGWAKCAIVDITDPGNPKVVGSFDTGNMYYRNLSAGVGKGNVYSYADMGGVYCYTIGDNCEKKLLYSGKTGIGERNGIANFDGKLLLTYNDGYIVMDPATAGNTAITSMEVHKIPKVYLRGKPATCGDTLVVSYGYGKQITIVDIGNVDAPVLKAQFNVDGTPDVAKISGNTILIPMRNKGLLLLEEK